MTIRTIIDKVYQKKKYVIIFFICLLLILAILLYKKSDNRKQAFEEGANVYTEQKSVHTEQNSYTVEYSKDWVFEKRSIASEYSFEDSCESLTHSNENHWIGFCGPSVWPLNEVVNNVLTFGETANGKRTDFVIDNARAVMVESLSRNNPEIHVFVEGVRFAKYSVALAEAGMEKRDEAEVDEEELAFESGVRFGTLDIYFLPEEKVYTEEEYEQLKSSFLQIVSGMKFGDR